MEHRPTFERARTALLSIDFQRDIASEGGKLAPDSPDALERFEEAVERAGKALATARSLELNVFHVRVAFRPEHPEANRHMPLLAGIAEAGALVEGGAGVEFVPELAPTDGEIVVTKRAVSAFTGSDLDVLLRSAGVDTLILMGLVTHFAVEGTARDAADRGYRVLTLADCCASGGRERHEAALDILGRVGGLLRAADLAAAVV